MASGTIKGTASGDYRVIIEWSSTPDIEANSSSVVMKTYITYKSIDISKRTGTTNIDGVSASFDVAALDKSSGSPLLVNTRKATVKHGEDGKKSIGISASFPFKLDSSSVGWVGTLKASGTAALDDIPRASGILSQTKEVCADGMDRYTLQVSPHSDSFWHRAWLRFGDDEMELGPFQTMVQTVLPSEWLEKIPTQMRSTAEVEVQTYSDAGCETAVGEPVTDSFTICVPESAVPVWNGVRTVEAVHSGEAAALGATIKGMSRQKISVDAADVTCMYGAELGSVHVRMPDGGQTSGNPCTTGLFGQSGTVSYEAWVTDSRGLASEAQTFVLQVQEYYRPAMSGVSIYRCDAQGNADDQGTWLYFRADVDYADCGGANGCTLTAEYGIVGGETTVSQQIAIGEAAILGAGGIQTVRSYACTLTAVDTAGNAASYSAVVGTADAALHLREGGNGGGLGKYGEREGWLDSAWSIATDGDMEAAGGITAGGNMEATGSVSAGSIASRGAISAEGDMTAGGGITAGGAVSGASGSFDALQGGEATFTGAVKLQGGAYDADGVALTARILEAEKQGGTVAVTNNSETYTILHTAEVSGVYLVNYSCKWVGNATGMRRLRLCKQKAEGSYDARALTSMYAGGSSNVHQQITAVMSLTAGQSIAVAAWQNSGSTINIDFSYYQVVRL